MQTELGPTGRLHTQLIYELTRAVAEATDLEAIFEAALTCLGGSLGVTKSSILLFEDDDRMHFKAWRSLSADYRAAVDGHSPWERNAVDPRPVLVEDVALDPELEQLREVIEGEGIRSLAFIPLVAGSKLIGKFMVYYDHPHQFTETELMTSETIAAQVAFALERQLTLEANARLDALNKIVIDSFGVAVYTTDANGLITRYNEAAADLWGRRPVLGQEMWCGSWRIFWPDGTPMGHDECPMGICLKENRAVRGSEILVENPDGSRHTVLPYPTPLHDSAGNLIGAVNVLVDITGQTQMRAELEAALIAKDDFLGQVSHELRTPLTQLIGNAHLLVNRWDAIDDETKADSMAEMMSQSQRMQRLIDNMLVLSRLERGITPEAEPQLIQRLLDTTLEEFGRRYPETKLEMSIAEGLPPVETNPSTIDQILWNLLTNAQKYGPPEGPILVKACAERGWIEVSVCDSGAGVPEADIERLFEPYYRSASTSGQATGLGLGLSVCKTLIDSQGGRIWAKRCPTGGMEFGFALPALGDGA